MAAQAVEDRVRAQVALYEIEEHLRDIGNIGVSKEWGRSVPLIRKAERLIRDAAATLCLTEE